MYSLSVHGAHIGWASHPTDEPWSAWCIFVLNFKDTSIFGLQFVMGLSNEFELSPASGEFSLSEMQKPSVGITRKNSLNITLPRAQIQDTSLAKSKVISGSDHSLPNFISLNSATASIAMNPRPFGLIHTFGSTSRTQKTWTIFRMTNIEKEDISIFGLEAKWSLHV